MKSFPKWPLFGLFLCLFLFSQCAVLDWNGESTETGDGTSDGDGVDKKGEGSTVETTAGWEFKPSPGTKNISLNSMLMAVVPETFDESSLNSATITETEGESTTSSGQAFKVEREGAPGWIEFEGTLRTLTYHSYHPFQMNHHYQIVVAGLKDQSGAVYPLIQWDFWTGTEQDTSAPDFVAGYPSVMRQVGGADYLEIYLSEPFDPASLQEAILVLRRLDGSVIPGAFLFEPLRGYLRLIPFEPGVLREPTLFSFSIRGLKDLAGNLMDRSTDLDLRQPVVPPPQPSPGPEPTPDPGPLPNPDPQPTPRDPVTTSFTPSADTTLRSGNKNKNQGDEDRLKIQGSGKNRVLVRFDKAAIQQTVGEARLISAVLRFNTKSKSDDWGGSGRTLGLYPLDQGWSEMGATWVCPIDTNTANNKGDCDDPWFGGSFGDQRTDAVLITDGLDGVVDFNVTTDLSNLLSSNGLDFGWLVKKEEESRSGNIEFDSRETSNPPLLILTYQP